MIYSNAQPVKYLRAIERLILDITDDPEDVRELIGTIESVGVHPRGQVMVAHGRASRHAGAVMVEWESPDLYRYRVTIVGHGRIALNKKHITKLLEPDPEPETVTLPRSAVDQTRKLLADIMGKLHDPGIPDDNQTYDWLRCRVAIRAMGG